MNKFKLLSLISVFALGTSCGVSAMEENGDTALNNNQLLGRKLKRNEIKNQLSINRNQANLILGDSTEVPTSLLEYYVQNGIQNVDDKTKKSIFDQAITEKMRSDMDELNEIRKNIDEIKDKLNFEEGIYLRNDYPYHYVLITKFKTKLEKYRKQLKNNLKKYSENVKLFMTKVLFEIQGACKICCSIPGDNLKLLKLFEKFFPMLSSLFCFK